MGAQEEEEEEMRSPGRAHPRHIPMVPAGPLRLGEEGVTCKQEPQQSAPWLGRAHACVHMLIHQYLYMHATSPVVISDLRRIRSSTHEV